MELKYDYWTGAFDDVSTSLRRSIAKYILFNKVKVGITGNPERRFS